MRTSGSTTDAAARLQKLDTGCVSDALDALGVRGVILGLGPVSVPRRIAGAAVTVRLGPAAGRRPDRHLFTAAIEAAAPGDVIVVEHGGRTDAAGWGGLLSLAAYARGLAGTVVDGAV